LAVGTLSCFQQAGVAVPDKVSVLGYDDSDSNKFTVPSPGDGCQDKNP
jgi:LacI family transcriptional regulator